MNTKIDTVHLQRIRARCVELLAIAENRTPGGWHFEPGGGHAPNRIVGAESVQTSGWRGRINGVSNASYTDRICENLGDPALPHPAANVAFIASCAGAAEAGWRNTIGRIDFVTTLEAIGIEGLEEEKLSIIQDSQEL